MTQQSVSHSPYWFGIVEDRDDPLKLGRVRVRIHNLHADKDTLPTAELHWSPVMMSPTSASTVEIGHSPTGLIVGSTVMGIFADGDEHQMPIVIGTIHGMPEIQTNGQSQQVHDVAQLARGIQNIVKEYVPDVEPESSYQSKYPFNKTWTTEGKHVFEVDDTPDHERVHVFHTKGTYVEIRPDGTVVVKSVAHSFDITVKDSTTYVGGNATVIILGNAGIGVKGNAQVNCEGNLTANTQGTTSVYSKGKTSISCDDAVDVRARGDITMESDSNINLKGVRINLND